MKIVKDIFNEKLKDSKTVSDEEAEQAFTSIIKWLGEDPAREGLKSTPKRLVKAYKEYFKGYTEDPKKFLAKTFSIREVATTTVTFSFVYWLNVFTNEYSILAPTVKAVLEGRVQGVVVHAKK